MLQQDFSSARKYLRDNDVSQTHTLQIYLYFAPVRGYVCVGKVAHIPCVFHLPQTLCMRAHDVETKTKNEEFRERMEILFEIKLGIKTLK